jgi:hypothetical protein
MQTILLKIGKSILLSLLTEKVMKKLVVLILEKLSEKTTNKVDDEMVKIVKEALG